MISTSIAARRRIALLAQQQPSLGDNRQQQQEGSTDFQWIRETGRTAFPDAGVVRSGAGRTPSHRMPARAPVIGSMDDRQRPGIPDPASHQSAARARDARGALDAAIQQA